MDRKVSLCLTFSSGPSPRCYLLTQDTAFTNMYGRRREGLEPQRRQQVQVSQIVVISLVSFKIGRKNESNWTKPWKYRFFFFLSSECQVLRSAGFVKVLLGGRRQGLKANLTEILEKPRTGMSQLLKDSRMCLNCILLFVFLQILVLRSCFPHDSSLKLYECKRHLPTSLLCFYGMQNVLR